VGQLDPDWDFSSHMRANDALGESTVVDVGLQHSAIGVSRVKCGRQRTGRTEAYDPHEAYLVVLRLSAYRVEHLWVDGKPVTHNALAPGTLSIYDLDRLWFAEMREPFDCLQFHVSQNAIDQLADETGMKGRQRLYCPPDQSGIDEVMHRLGRVLVPALARRQAASRLFIEHLTLAFHAHLLSRYRLEGSPVALRAKGLAPWQERRVTDFLRENLEFDVSVEALARECGLSRSYFMKAFKQTTGVSPHQWVLAQRMDRAKNLLQSGSMSISDVAVASGFSDQSHLTRTFGRMEGTTPAAWRRNL